MFGGSSSLCRQTLLCWQSTHEKHEPITNAVRARTAARRIGRRIQPCDSLDGRESRSHGGSGYSYALGHGVPHCGHSRLPTYPGRRRRLHARAWISDRGLHCHYSVAGAAAACALTIRRDAHDRAGVRRHADARATAQHSTAQHSTALFQCHDCTAAPAALPPALRGCALAQHPAGAASHRIAWATGFHACRVAAAQPRKPTRADVLPVERCSLSPACGRVWGAQPRSEWAGWRLV